LDDRSSDATVPPAAGRPGLQHHGGRAALTLGALGVVFGDIGTSPLYAMKETFSGAHELAPAEANVYGVISLVLWAITIIVSLKYVLLVLRADNGGEGGSWRSSPSCRTSPSGPHARCTGSSRSGSSGRRSSTATA